MHNRHVHVGAAALNQTVGDWEGNTQRIIRAISEARDQQVRLLVLPEMCISGYSLGDRLLRAGTMAQSLECLRAVIPHTADIIVAVGLPVLQNEVVHNVMAVLASGSIAGLVVKENLATGDVEYENRWFQPWPHGKVQTFVMPDGEAVPMGTLIFEAQGVGRFALEICEDGWMGIRPGSTYALAGAEIICNPSASWFTVGKNRVRRSMVSQISREDYCVYVYTSLLGCDSTRLVFEVPPSPQQAVKSCARGAGFSSPTTWISSTVSST